MQACYPPPAVPAWARPKEDPDLGEGVGGLGERDALTLVRTATTLPVPQLEVGGAVSSYLHGRQLLLPLGKGPGERKWA